MTTRPAAVVLYPRDPVRVEPVPPDEDEQSLLDRRRRRSAVLRDVGLPVLLGVYVTQWFLDDRMRWVLPAIVLLALAACLPVVLRWRRAADGAAVPVPPDRAGALLEALRRVDALRRARGRLSRWRFESPASREATALLRRWGGLVARLRGAWTAGDEAAWREHARTLERAGPRAVRVLGELEAAGR